MQKDLVSILTPCYNTGSIVHRLLDSILMQDYPFVEMFAINDGSTDNTEEIIKSYIPKFEAKGYKLIYVHQENGGQSAAINYGLKLISGEYLIWPDSDDFFRQSYSISIFVDSLSSKSDKYGIVRCLPTIIDESSLEEKGCEIWKDEYMLENQFENCLFIKNFFWGAGDYMVRMQSFDNVNPNREIYVDKNAGQNWQMLLPVLYSYKCVTLKESLFNVLERTDSHSRGLYRTYEQQMEKFKSYKNTILYTIDNIATMPDEDKEKYSKKIVQKYMLQELEIAVAFNKKNEERNIINVLVNEGVEIPYKTLRNIRISKTLLGKIIFKCLSIIRKLHNNY